MGGGSKAHKKAMGAAPSSSAGEAATSPGVLVFESLKDWKPHFENSKKTNKLIVIYFKAGWCGPCRLMKPIFAEFASKYKNAVFIEVDVDKLNGVDEEFEVREMPTFVLIKQGKVVDKVVGAKKIELKEAIEKHLK